MPGTEVLAPMNVHDTPEAYVRIVRKVGENDVEVTPTFKPMVRVRAERVLRNLANAGLIDRYELCYVDANGQPTRYASWAI